MNAIDYLIFNYVKWFADRDESSVGYTPLERAVNVLGVATMFWAVIVYQLVFSKYVKLESTTFEMLMGGIGVASLFIYKYIYINKSRYHYLSERVDSGQYLRKHQIFSVTIFLASIIVGLITMVMV